MYYLNGKYVKEEDAKISILDLSILRGFSIFDYLRTYNGRPFHLWDHLLRLKYSSQQIGLSLPKSLPEIEEIVLHTVKTAHHRGESSIKILVTGGISKDQFTPNPEGNLIVFAYPLYTYPKDFFAKGIKVVTTRLNRSLPMSKTTHYTPAIMAMQQGKASDAQEVLYVNARDEILEATTSNFFAFKNDTLYTCCSDEMLIGITREVVLKLSAPHFPIQMHPLKYEEIKEMQEAFITSSNKEVMPVVQIDSFPIGDGKVGPRTQRIMELFRAYTQNGEWPPLNIPRYASNASV
jgi:branched-chain amino acid aminotransferase